MLPRLIPGLISFSTLVFADVKFSSPTPGTSVSGLTVTAAWEEGGGSYPISTLAGYTLFLVAGGDTDATAQIVAQVAGNHATDKAMSLSIPIAANTAGPGGSNAYYLKMVSAGTSVTVINYSDRFTVSSMSGTWKSPSFQQAYNSAKGDITKVPQTQTQNTGNQNNPGANGAGGDQYSVPYSEQTTGLTKFAPMQQHAPTAITKQDKAPLFPTTSWDIATAYLPTASQLTTLTASNTFSAATRINTAAAAEMPSDDMAKFLARWKD